MIVMTFKASIHYKYLVLRKYLNYFKEGLGLYLQLFCKVFVFSPVVGWKSFVDAAFFVGAIYVIFMFLDSEKHGKNERRGLPVLGERNSNAHTGIYVCMNRVFFLRF